MTLRPCAVCGRPAEVTVRVVWADAIDVSPWCMDCAADVVEQEMGEVVDVIGGVS